MLFCCVRECACEGGEEISGLRCVCAVRATIFLHVGIRVISYFHRKENNEGRKESLA